MDELNNWGCRHLPFNVAAAPAFRYNFATKSTAQNLQRGFHFNQAAFQRQYCKQAKAQACISTCWLSNPFIKPIKNGK
jgi:hypothetical protein